MMDYGECVDLLCSKADKLGKEKGRKLASSIPEFKSSGWLISALVNTAKSSLPTLMGYMEQAKTLKNEPAGNLAPNPKSIIVDDAIFDVNF